MLAWSVGVAVGTIGVLALVFTRLPRGTVRRMMRATSRRVFLARVWLDERRPILRRTAREQGIAAYVRGWEEGVNEGRMAEKLRSVRTRAQ